MPFAFGGILPDLFHGRAKRSFLSHSLVGAFALSVVFYLMYLIPFTVADPTPKVLLARLPVLFYIYAGAVYHLVLDYPTELGVYGFTPTRIYAGRYPYSSPTLNLLAVLLPALALGWLMSTQPILVVETSMKAFEQLFPW